jgi:pimeloyl-ACP methyl ester carboxylesterase
MPDEHSGRRDDDRHDGPPIRPAEATQALSVRYAHTTDGASIAFASHGAGPVLLIAPNVPLSHVEVEWRHPESRSWFARLALGRTLVRYDHRGSGLSDRPAQDFALDALVRDIEAVVDALALERFAIFAVRSSGPAAIAFVLAHPDQLSHLVLWQTAATNYHAEPPIETQNLMLEGDWDTYVEAVCRYALRGVDEAVVSRHMELLRRSADKGTLLRFLQSRSSHDAYRPRSDGHRAVEARGGCGLSWSGPMARSSPIAQIDVEIPEQALHRRPGRLVAAQPTQRRLLDRLGVVRGAERREHLARLRLEQAGQQPGVGVLIGRGPRQRRPD